MANLDASKLKKSQRFKGVQGVRQYVSKALVALENLIPADNAESIKIQTAKFSGARLMVELITSTALEKRIKQLEKEEAAKMAAAIAASSAPSTVPLSARLDRQ